MFPTVRHAIAAATRRDPDRFRVVHFSVQFDHVHLVVEAEDSRSLSSGMRSLVIRIARSINTLVPRKGAVWADRWFGRTLTSPRQVRLALLYVLANVRKHARRPLPAGIDVYSSGRWFDGWLRSSGARAGPPGITHALAAHAPDSAPVSAPRTWLAQHGWQRHGLLGLDEAPASAAKRR